MKYWRGEAEVNYDREVENTPPEQYMNCIK